MMGRCKSCRASFETDKGFAVIEPVMKKTPSDVLLILCDCHTQFANLMGLSLMTDDGEASEGAALEGGGAWQSDVLHQPRAG